MKHVLLVLCLVAGPALSQASPEGRLYAFVTNRYVSDFADLRRGIALTELLNACGDEERPALTDHLFALELRLKKALIAEAVALDQPGLPAADERRSLVALFLQGFEATDATVRAGMLADLAGMEICEKSRAEADAIAPPAR